MSEKMSNIPQGGLYS